MSGKTFLVLSLAGTILLGTVQTLESKVLSPEELAAIKQRLQSMIAQEGLSPENRYLKGHFVSRVPAKRKYSPYLEEGFPYKWNFDDGTLCGINEKWQMEDVKVEEGTLSFKVAAAGAFFSWGDFEKKGPPLHIGFPTKDGYSMPRIAAVKIRMKQSLETSVWQISVRRLNDQRGKEYVSKEVTVKGSEWQDVLIPTDGLGPVPCTGFRLLTKTEGNNVQIDYLVPCAEPRMQYRTVVEIPAKVRWARVSIVSETFHYLYVNGKLAVKSPPYVRCSQIWNYEIDPSLFRIGKNVIAEENSIWFGGGFILDGALLCEDGTYIRFDSDEKWKGPIEEAVEGTAWMMPDYDDSGWAVVGVARNHPNAPSVYDNLLRPQEGNVGVGYSAFWFNPSWKGQMMVEPADGRSQPVYGSKEGISLKVSVPYRQAETQEITYELFDEMGDGFHAFDTLVKKGSIPLKKTGLDNSGVLKFSPGELKHNVAYAVVFHFSVNGQEVEKYRYEIAVCGPVEQPVVENPKDYTDGMKLKLVWQVDAAEEQKEGEFISCSGDSTIKPSKVITTPLGRFRCTYDGPDGLKSAGGSHCHYISFKFEIKNPGRPHVAIAEYPDDTQRVQEMRISDWAFWGATMILGNDTAVMGIEHPNTHQISYHHCVFFPSQTVGTVSFFAMEIGKWKPEMAARVGKIWIYEIENDIPARKIVDAPGPTKWLGQQAEAGPRQVMQSCLMSPIMPIIWSNLSHSERPNFYQSWMVTYINMVKRMRFAGENAYHYGQFMYDRVLYPGVYSDQTEFAFGYSGSLKDSGVLMAKIFEENGLGWFSGIEMMAHARVKMTSSDYEISQGAETFAAIGKDGRQRDWRGNVYPNWIHPQVRRHFETVMNELITLYGKEKGWKGITLQINEELGPCWVTFDGDPYFSSYDDYTISEFEKDTKIRIPVERKDPERFKKRYDWLMGNQEAKKKWTDWRCAKMAEIYQWLKKRLKQTRPDLKLVLFTNANSYMNPPAEWTGDKKSAWEYSRAGGLDIGQFIQDPDVICCHTVNGDVNYVEILTGKTPNEKHNRFAAHRDDFLSALTNDGKNGVTVRYNWYEPQPKAPEGWQWWHRYCDAEAWPFPSGEYFSDYWTNIFIRTNPTTIVHSLQDITMWNGRETDMARFAHAFRSIPVGKYTRLTGKGRDTNIWIAITSSGKDSYGYIANPQWWTVESTIELASGVSGADLIENKEISGRSWKLTLGPYEIRTFRFAGAGGGEIIGACQTEVSEKGKEFVKGMIAEKRKLVSDYLQLAGAEGEFVLKQLKDTGWPGLIEKMAESAEKAANSGDYSAAYEILTASREYVLAGRAFQTVKKIVKGPETAAEALRLAYQELAVKKNYEAARRLYQQALKFNDPVRNGEAQLGIAYTYTNQTPPLLAEAKPEFLKVLTIPGATHNQKGESYEWLARIAQELDKDLEQARKYRENARNEYLKAVNQTDLHGHNRTIALYRLVISLISEQKYKEAAEIASSIKNISTPHPGYLPWVYEAWASALVNLKDYPAARQVLGELSVMREASPDTRAKAFISIGDCFRKENFTSDARQAYEKALKVPDVSEGVRKKAGEALKALEG